MLSGLAYPAFPKRSVSFHAFSTGTAVSSGVWVLVICAVPLLFTAAFPLAVDDVYPSGTLVSFTLYTILAPSLYAGRLLHV